MRRVLAVALIAATACTGGSEPIPLPDYGIDLPPEILLELPPKNETERLLASARQTTPFCVMVASLDRLEEPRPDDVQEQVAYAQSTYNQLFSLDPASKVRNTDNAAGGRVVLPSAMVAAVARLRTQMHAYLVRVRLARGLLAEGRIDKTEVRRRSDDAFLRLAASDYGAADRSVTEYSTKACR